MNELQANPINSMTDEQWGLVKKTLLDTDKVKYSDDEFKLFVNQCKRTGLDPFTRQIYATKTKDKMTVQATIDGLRLVAMRSKEYQGQTRPMWFDNEGKEYRIWTKEQFPYACEVGVLRKDFKEPMYAIAIFDEYVASYIDFKTNEKKIGYMWQKMPALMIAKVAEALALRKAFPNDMSGIYSQEEIPSVISDDKSDKTNPSVSPNFSKQEMEKINNKSEDSHIVDVTNYAPISRRQADDLNALGKSKSLSLSDLNKIIYEVSKKTKWSDLNITEYELILNKVLEIK